MKKNKYKILLFNNSKGLIREILLSKSILFAFIIIFLACNFLTLYFFSDHYLSWKSDREIQNHKKNNQLLIDNILIAENRISNIEEKINTIINYDNEMRDMLSMPRIH